MITDCKVRKLSLVYLRLVSCKRINEKVSWNTLSLAHSPLVSVGFKWADTWSWKSRDRIKWFSLASRDIRRSSGLWISSKSCLESEFLSLRTKQKQNIHHKQNQCPASRIVRSSSTILSFCKFNSHYGGRINVKFTLFKLVVTWDASCRGRSP